MTLIFSTGILYRRGLWHTFFQQSKHFQNHSLVTSSVFFLLLYNKLYLGIKSSNLFPKLRNHFLAFIDLHQFLRLKRLKKCFNNFRRSQSLLTRLAILPLTMALGPIDMDKEICCIFSSTSAWKFFAFESNCRHCCAVVFASFHDLSVWVVADWLPTCCCCCCEGK